MAPAEKFVVTRAQLERWQKEALAWKTPSIGVEIMHVLDQCVQPSHAVASACGVQMVSCPECNHQWDHFFVCSYAHAPAHQSSIDKEQSSS